MQPNRVVRSFDVVEMPATNINGPILIRNSLRELERSSFSLATSHRMTQRNSIETSKKKKVKKKNGRTTISLYVSIRSSLSYCGPIKWSNSVEWTVSRFLIFRFQQNQTQVIRILPRRSNAPTTCTFNDLWRRSPAQKYNKLKGTKMKPPAN